MVQRKFTLLSSGIIVLLLLTACTFIDKNSKIEENTSQTNYDEDTNAVNSLPLFNGNVSKSKNNNVQSLKMSKKKWLEVKQAFLKDHKTFSIDDIKNLSVSDFKAIEVWEGTLNGKRFKLGLSGNNDNFFVLDSRYDEQERSYLLLEFFERPWLFYGESIRFQQLAKGMGVSYNIVTGNNAKIIDDYGLVIE